MISGEGCPALVFFWRPCCGEGFSSTNVDTFFPLGTLFLLSGAFSPPVRPSSSPSPSRLIYHWPCSSTPTPVGLGFTSRTPRFHWETPVSHWCVWMRLGPNFPLFFDSSAQAWRREPTPPLSDPDLLLRLCPRDCNVKLFPRVCSFFLICLAAQIHSILPI